MRRWFWYSVFALGIIEGIYVLGMAGYSLATERGEPCPDEQACYGDADYGMDQYP